MTIPEIEHQREMRANKHEVVEHTLQDEFLNPHDRMSIMCVVDMDRVVENSTGVRRG
jgi:hypothetical protein